MASEHARIHESLRPVSMVFHQSFIDTKYDTVLIKRDVIKVLWEQREFQRDKTLQHCLKYGCIEN